MPRLNRHTARRGLTPVRLPAALPTPANRAAARARRELVDLVDRLVQRGGAQPADDLLDRLVQATDPETGLGLNAADVRDEATAAGGDRALTATRHGSSMRRCVCTRRLTRCRAGRPSTTSCVAIRIPAGRIVVVVIWGIHRNPRVWAEPHAFRPERFEASAAAELDRYAYLPFGAGPRACIGVHVARAELVIAAATVARAVAITSPGGEPRLTAGMTVSPDHSLRAAFRPR